MINKPCAPVGVCVPLVGNRLNSQRQKAGTDQKVKLTAETQESTEEVSRQYANRPREFQIESRKAGRCLPYPAGRWWVMDRVRTYSVACSLANLFLVVALTTMTWFATSRWFQLQTGLAVAVCAVGFLVYAIAVQRWLSVPVNVFLRWLIIKRGSGNTR